MVDGVERGTPGTGDVGRSSKAAHRQASNAGRPRTVDGVERGTPVTSDVGRSSKAAHRQASNAG